MANIAVLPSMWDEPFGLTIAEALATGLPLITTRSGGIPEICEGVATILDREHIGGSLRITFGESNTIDDVRYLIQTIDKIIG